MPVPGSTEGPSAAERLRQEVATLSVDDILALAYAFRQQPDRLRLYLDVLRQHGGQRAQFASTLICFDLARQGDPAAERDFVFLADTMRELAHQKDLVASLVGTDPYLGFLWELCEAQLAAIDPRLSAEALSLAPEDAEVATVDLLSDKDFAPDFGLQLDDAKLMLRFAQAVEDFLGGELGVPSYDPEAGLRLQTSLDVERVEAFLRELESLANLVPLARGYRALVLLFYGTNLRSRTMFGNVNKRKQATLRAGIREFEASGREMMAVAGVVSPLHASPEAWDKIADVLVDYVHWRAESPQKAALGPDGYDVVERLIARQPSAANRRRGVRY